MKKIKCNDRTTLLLDYGWQPLGVLTARSAFKHFIKKRVRALDKNINLIDFEDWYEGYGDFYSDQPCIASSSDLWPLPTIAIITEKFFRRQPKRNIVTFHDLCVFYDFQCQICLSRFPSSQLSVEHVKPRSKGGGECVSNKTLTCRKCNCRKGSIFPYKNIEGEELSGTDLSRNKLIIDRRIIREEWKKFL